MQFAQKIIIALKIDDVIKVEQQSQSQRRRTVRNDARVLNFEKEMNSPQSAITLVQKKGALVPQRSERKSALEANGYTLGKTLGEGAYAKVKLAISTKQNCHVAIKIINKRRASKEYLAKFLPREIQVLQRLKYPYVVSNSNYNREIGPKLACFVNCCPYSQGVVKPQATQQTV